MLTVSQFRAILAHEFAHFYSGDTRLGPWIFRARGSMARVLIGLGRESIILTVLSKWAVIALLRAMIVGALVLYWKLLTRVTAYISRRQEFRCDELACHIAGSESLEQGLCNVNRAAATFGVYWNQVVMPVTASGYRPDVADGFARFVSVPAIARAAESSLEQRLERDATATLDSHPPLGLRLQAARKLAIPAISDDTRPAITLIKDVQSLEVRLLQKLVPKINAAALQAMHWDTAGAEVYIPIWRRETALLQPLLARYNVTALPQAVKNLSEIGGRIPDPPGVLLTREQRVERAAEALSHALTLTFVDHGWQIYLQPGEFHVAHDNRKLETGMVVADLRTGKQTAAGWAEYCGQNGIADWRLVSSEAQ